MKYVIKYEYEYWDLGCQCTDYSSEVTIYLEGGRHVNCFYVPMMENEKELREYMDENHPEFKGFTVDHESVYF